MPPKTLPDPLRKACSDYEVDCFGCLVGQRPCKHPYSCCRCEDGENI